MDVFINGSYTDAAAATISPMDRGFLFADGVYEVIPAFNATLFGAGPHLSRLARSLAALEIPNPHELPQWEELCKELLSRNGGGNQAVYLQVTRGAPASRDQGFPATPVPPSVFMTTYPIKRSAVHTPDSAAGESAILVEDIRWQRCDIKTIGLLANVLCKQRAARAGAVEAIQIRDGQVTEGSSTNVFMVKDGEVSTPPAGHRILSGVTRQIVIDLCRDMSIPLRERDITQAELMDADEIWISSSTKDALPIVELEGQPVGKGVPGVVWKVLARQFLEYKRSICGPLDD